MKINNFNKLFCVFADSDAANLGLRLVASTVTSILILALLLFMVHRLRQRRLLIMMRRMFLNHFYPNFQHTGPCKGLGYLPFVIYCEMFSDINGIRQKLGNLSFKDLCVIKAP